MANDPVCGMDVNEVNALAAERDGETFYFCSEHCRQQFLNGGESRAESREPDSATQACCATEGCETIGYPHSRADVCGTPFFRGIREVVAL